MESVSSCILLFLLICIISLLVRGRSKPNPKHPPGPSPLPIIGNLIELGKKPHQSLAKLAMMHGPVMKLKLGQITTVVISSAEMAKEVLQTHDQFFSNRSVPHSVTICNHEPYGLAFMPVSPLWRELRKICSTELLSQKTLDGSKDLRRKIVQQLINEIQQSSQIGEAVEIGKSVFKTTINLLSNTIFSQDMVHSTSNAFDFKDLVTNITKLVGTPNLSDYFPVLKMFDPQRIFKHQSTNTNKVLTIFNRLVNQRIMQRSSTGFDASNDMLAALLNICQENKLMNNTVIEHLFFDLFIAGTDTTTSTLEWAMTELLHNPNVMLKAKQELDQTIGKGKLIEESDIARLPYLQAIIKETFRLHPPVPFLLPRKAARDVNINGYTVPKDAQVLINVWKIGRDPKTWDSPNIFLPERFLESKIDVKGQHFELTPFGGGRRICPGTLLATRMLLLMLGSLINSFDWKLEDGLESENMDMDEIFGITLQKAIPLRVVPIKI
ncbi:geraniol 8-hydroxylase-like [Gastrolobium bilobum]|uniref:geraniol 8-hydroxylase-like n=1 Tax=Gastrolobium bilobum TaxID=150636 RepID=UPI002AB24583|nr:geraniol 8-hydroxylase-like [Gastrolobium bilobum]